MQPMEMVSEGQFGLNPNVMAMADEQSRAQFFAGVDELNQFVNKAAEFGIDPSKEVITPQGRPMRLVQKEANPITELFV